MTQFQNFWNSFESVLYIEGFPNGSVVKNPPGMQETRVQYLGQEDALEEEMATYSSILVWKTSWTEEPSGLTPKSCKEWDTTEQLSTNIT